RRPTAPHPTPPPLPADQAAGPPGTQVRDTVAQGAGLVSGGGRLDRPGAFVQATALTDLRPGMRAYYEDLFGPVAVVYRVANEDEAVGLANDNPYGLGAAIFCRDVDRADRLAERLRVGQGGVNHPPFHPPRT